jgi:hypothetical protein
MDPVRWSAKREFDQARQVPQLRRDRAGELVVVQAQHGELGEVPQLRRDRAGERVRIEVQLLQVRELPKLRRNRARDTTAVDGQHLKRLEGDEAGQVPHLVGD